MRQARLVAFGAWLGFSWAIAGSFAGPARADAPAKSAAMQIGEPAVIENLTILPLFVPRAEDVGELTTLSAALERNEAEVRETGGDALPSPRNVEPLGSGAQVNTLVIENKGKLPIYVLAGTVVKGGKQDRQIGQDFVIAPNASVPVDAFCVEQGRWTTEREGTQTHGKFAETKGLASSDVRSAAQYKRDQGEVWAKVSEVNSAHKKSAPSHTLMATLDDAEVAKRREAMARDVEVALTLASGPGELAGFAYAVDGVVRSARWFANGRVFKLFRAPLIEAATLDALTAQERTGKRAAAPAKPEAVHELVEQVEAAQGTETRDTSGDNVNDYKEAARGYGSKTRLKGKPSAAPVSQDYVAK